MLDLVRALNWGYEIDDINFIASNKTYMEYYVDLP